MDQLLADLSSAVANQDWLSVVVSAVISLAVIVSGVLKALKKPVPILDTLIDLAKSIAGVLPKKAPPAPAPGEAEGIAKVVPVEDKSELK